jgi:catechol-2,3-dioxygenase
MQKDSGKTQPRLKLKFLSHGTLESKNLGLSRKFYEEFLGLEVVRTSNVSLQIRLGGLSTIAVVKSPSAKAPMPILNHNGLDVATQQEVEEAYRIVLEEKDKWGLHKISKPALQHGSFSFYFWDGDENCWEILTNPEGGYSWLFAKGDLEGRGYQDPKFERPGVKSDATASKPSD